jgi:predicted nucleotidyltransferase
MAPSVEELADAIRDVLASRPEVREGYLLGSAARGEMQPHSDVDVAVWVEVDLDRVHTVLNDHLEDFATFAAHVERHLAKP